MANKLICIIPAKAHSTRLPGKNIINCSNKPMIAYSIEAALKSKLFKQVFVSTGSKKISKIARRYGAVVPYKRPLSLTRDTAGVADVCLHMIDYLEKRNCFFRTLCVLLPTSPLRTWKDIRKAYQIFRSKKAKFLMGITQYVYQPFEALRKDKNGSLAPYWGYKYTQMKRQNRPNLFVDNGAIYLMDIQALKKEKTFYGKKLIGYFMPLEKSVDVNTRLDLKIAECLLRR